MKKTAMVAAVNYSKSDGIFKKIVSQTKALSIIYGESLLYCFGEDCVYKICFSSGEPGTIKKYKNNSLMHNSNSLNYISKLRNLLKVALNDRDLNKCELVYIRHMFPSVFLLKFLSSLKRTKIKIVYEIPTYPYYSEQYNVSNNKLKTVLRLCIESIYWPFIYYYIDKLCTIRANTNTKNFSKMKNIYNGIDSYKTMKQVDGKKNLESSKFEIIGIGTIYPYHGFDRIIRSIAECNGLLDNGKMIVFHIVGFSDEIEKLKQLTSELKIMDNVIFHGKQFGDSLDLIYDKCLMGIGTLRLSMRKANIDTAIKNIEYLGRNLPVITSGLLFDIDSNSGFYKIINEDENINLNDLYNFCVEFYNDDKSYEIGKLLRTFEWKNIIQNIIEEL